MFGFDPKSSLLQPLNVAQLILETIGKSMFVTVLGSDVLMRANLSAWRNHRNFSGTEEANNYDYTMENLERISSYGP